MTVLLLCKDDFYVILSIESAVSAKGELFFMWNNIEDMILYEDRDIIVCHKVAGIAVQSARIGMPDMESTLKNYLASKKQGQCHIWGLFIVWISRWKGCLFLQKIKGRLPG